MSYRILTNDQLQKLPFHNLIRLFRKVTAVKSKISRSLGQRCCNICNEYVGSDWESDVGIHLKEHDEYLSRIKVVLQRLPHVAENKLRRRKN